MAEQEKTMTEEYDAKHGKYEDTVGKKSVEERLPTKQLPQGPDPSPFTLGPLAGGERK